MKLRPVGTVFF